MQQTVIRLPIDVSGPMQESFGPRAAERLGAVWRSLRSAANEAATMRVCGGNEPLLFAYRFGVRGGGVVDLAAVSSPAALDPERVATEQRLGDCYCDAARKSQPAGCSSGLRDLRPPKPSRGRFFGAPRDTVRVAAAVMTGSTGHALDFAREMVRNEAERGARGAERPMRPTAGEVATCGGIATITSMCR